ncbi:hypothetical protein TRVL_09568 [Trypanosoma vivax]|nr:hypothetical protein TRVL_09568 [Trypanosoma vivax]
MRQERHSIAHKPCYSEAPRHRCHAQKWPCKHTGTSAHRAIGLATCQCKYSLGTGLRLVMLLRVSHSSGTLSALLTRNMQRGRCEQAHRVKCWGHHANVAQWRRANSGAA